MNDSEAPQRTAEEERVLDDPARAHGEEMLRMLDVGMQERDEQLADLFNAAWRQAAEADKE